MITNLDYRRGLVYEHEPHRFAAFASDLCDHGFGVGQWPDQIDTELGNGQPFVKSRHEISEDGEDLVAVNYTQLFGCITLRVFND